MTMLKAFVNFFKPPIFEDEEEKTRVAGLLSRILLFTWAVPILIVLVSFLRNTITPTFLILVPVTILAIIATTVTVRRGYVRAASMAFIAVLVAAATYNDFLSGGELRPAIIVYAWVIIVGGLLLGGRGAIVTSVLLVIQQALLGWLAATGGLHPIVPENPPLSNFLIIAIGYVLVAFTFSLAAGSIQTAFNRVRASQKSLAKSNEELQDLTQTLEQRVQERTIDLEQSNQINQERARELQIVADVARAVASLQDPDSLLPEITQIISARFGYYHIGIFLLDDEREYAMLRAANSAGGKRMLEREHKLRLAPTSIVGYVASSSKPRVSSDVGSDSVYFNNPDLPETHAEMALPLIVGSQLIGVLDIQSTEPSAFGKEQIEVLGTLANQVAVAIENARLFGQTRQALAESQRIYDEFVAQRWAQYSKIQTTFGYRFEKGKISSLASPLEVSSPSSVKEVNAGELTLPIQIRNQKIGMLSVRPAEASRRWSENELAVAHAAVERAALALENARLLDDAQRRSARERSIGEISTRISALNDIDSIMRSAVEELGHRLGSSAEVTLELDSDNQE
jgi:GAF domain-containing protein